MYNAVAENVLGTAGTVCWCIQLIPQIIRNYKVKDCTGFPPMMMFLWAASGIPFGIYFFGTDGSIPLRIQPQLFTVFCLISWAQALYYPPVQMNKKKMMILITMFVLVTVGLEIGLILWLRPLQRRGTTYPMLIVGIVASILLAAGLIPPYFEIAKRKGRVVGINFVFLFVDSLGALLSMASVLVGTFDTLSIALYAIVLGLEMGIFGSQIFWYTCLGGRKTIKKEKEEKKLEEKTQQEQENDTPEQDDTCTCSKASVELKPDRNVVETAILNSDGNSVLSSNSPNPTVNR